MRNVRSAQRIDIGDLTSPNSPISPTQQVQTSQKIPLAELSDINHLSLNFSVHPVPLNSITRSSSKPPPICYQFPLSSRFKAPVSRPCYECYQFPKTTPLSTNSSVSHVPTTQTRAVNYANAPRIIRTISTANRFKPPFAYHLNSLNNSPPIPLYHIFIKHPAPSSILPTPF